MLAATCCLQANAGPAQTTDKAENQAKAEGDKAKAEMAKEKNKKADDAAQAQDKLTKQKTDEKNASPPKN